MTSPKIVEKNGFAKEGNDGNISVRLTIPKNLWLLAGKLAEQWKINQSQAMGIMLDQVSRMVEHSNANVLGPMFQFAYERLLATDGAALDDLPPADISKLARSTRTKSGFSGVYANGKGFRAMARSAEDSRVQTSIGTYPTAERAAWARYVHYTKNKLPYGEAEIVLDDDGEAKFYREYLRKALGREATPEEVLAEVNQGRRESGRPEIDVGDIELPAPQIVTT